MTDGQTDTQQSDPIRVLVFPVGVRNSKKRGFIVKILVGHRSQSEEHSRISRFVQDHKIEEICSSIFHWVRKFNEVVLSLDHAVLCGN